MSCPTKSRRPRASRAIFAGIGGSRRPPACRSVVCAGAHPACAPRCTFVVEPARSFRPGGRPPPSARRAGPGPSVPHRTGGPVPTRSGTAPGRGSPARNRGRLPISSSREGENAGSHAVPVESERVRDPRHRPQDHCGAAPYIALGKGGKIEVRHRHRSWKHLPSARQARYGRVFMLAPLGFASIGHRVFRLGPIIPHAGLARASRERQDLPPSQRCPHAGWSRRSPIVGPVTCAPNPVVRPELARRPRASLRRGSFDYSNFQRSGLPFAARNCDKTRM